MLAYVALGANLGPRERTIAAALERLDEDPLALVAVSAIRETEPVGVTDQPRFLNAVAAVETALGPRELLDTLLAIERELGRDRTHAERWGPRVIDLDLLLYGELEIDEPGLTVPHARLAERRFVLEPLVELDPALRLPDGRVVRDLLLPELE